MNGDFHVADDGVGSYIGDQMFFVPQKTNEEPALDEPSAEYDSSH